MPRRNKTPKHTPFKLTSPEANKVRYGTKQAAEKAAELRMLENPVLKLAVYQALNGSWYLTSKSKD